MIERLEVRPGGLGIYYRVPSEQGPEGIGKNGDLKNKKAVGNFVFPTALGSYDLKFGVTVWSVVEPLWLEFELDAAWRRVDPVVDSKSLEFKEKTSLSGGELKAKLEQLLCRDRKSLKQAAEEVGVSVTTVRRVCRTLQVGRYAPSAQRNGAVAKSSQVPFGWTSEQGVLREAPSEMKWVRLAREMRDAGQSDHAIARHFQKVRVPTKNGGRWYARTILQILDFNSRVKKNVRTR